jgi:hypothetical protein
VLLSTATAERTAQYAASPNIQVVANTPAVQAARALSAGVLAVNLWAAAGTASIVTSQDPGSVVLVEAAGATRTIRVAR